jgi:hypothetical protein
MTSLGCPYEIRPHALSLLALASGPWTPAEIRRACEANGWAFEEDHPRTKGFSFRLNRDLRLSAVFEPSPRVPAPHCHVLLYPHFPVAGQDFPDEARDHFDRALETSFDALMAELGDPESCGVHEIGWGLEPCYSYAIWRGKRGLLVLQQDEYDLYCGMFAVSVYLHPWDEHERGPGLPLAVWGPGLPL